MDYRTNASFGFLANFFRPLKTGFSLIHSSEAIGQLKKLLDKEKPDIAHLHNIYHQLTPSIITFLSDAGLKVVLTLHDYKLICPSYSMIRDGHVCNECRGKHFFRASRNKCEGNSFLRSLLLSFEAYWHIWKKSYDAVDVFICPSRFMADLVSRYRIERERVRIIHNGINLGEYRRSEVDEGYALYFGRLSKEKGIETLLKAHQTIADLIPLKVVGTGPLLESLKNRYPKTQFVGFKTEAELKALVRGAAFVVVPSEWYENCSMSVIEAMGFGKPVIGSRIGGLPEQIEHNKTGFLFEMGNVTELTEKMAVLAADPYMRKDMGRAGRVKAEQEYNLKTHCSALMSLYEELLGQR